MSIILDFVFLHADGEDGNIDNDNFPAGGGRWMLERRLRESAPSGIVLGGEMLGLYDGRLV